MNKERRKALNAIQDNLEELRDELERILEEEESYRDNMPENMIGGERYEKADQSCNDITDAISNLEEVILSVGSAAIQS